MDAAGGERSRYQRIGEHVPAGHDRCAPQGPHHTRRDLLGRRHARREPVSAHHSLSGDPRLSQRSQHRRRDSAARAVSTAARFGAHHHRLAHPRALQKLERVGAQLAGRGHQHRGTQRASHRRRHHRVGPTLARHQHHRRQRTPCVCGHRLGNQQRRRKPVRAPIANRLNTAQVTRRGRRRRCSRRRNNQNGPSNHRRRHHCQPHPAHRGDPNQPESRRRMPPARPVQARWHQHSAGVACNFFVRTRLAMFATCSARLATAEVVLVHATGLWVSLIRRRLLSALGYVVSASLPG